jgi:RNA polymerase sigma-70 factor (ECF subfamily)
MTRAEETGAGLSERFRSGDEDCFEEVTRLYRKDLYRIALRILGSHEDADEATQEALVRAWRSMGRFQGRSSLKTWLVRIVVNVSRSLLKRRREVVSLDPEIAVPDGSEGSEEKALRGELFALVREAVSKLPRRQREVVWLKIFSGLRHREVAAAMGLTEGAVKAHLHQAVSNLRARFSPDAVMGKETVP